MKQPLFSWTFVSTMATALAAQANVVPGLDGRLTVVDDLTYYGRRGPTFPNGEVGMAMLNEMCNPGSVVIPWQAAMQPNHPKFGFLIVRVVGDRLEQISDRSFCKHAFVSTNYTGPCGPCQNPGTGSVMGLRCADTYDSSNNADRTWLGPAPEIDPWLGTWNPVGSYFDIGDPTQSGYPFPADGVRSLVWSGFDQVKNRVTVKESDLLTPGASYFYGIHLLHQGEAVANRGDNLASRGFMPVGSASGWSFANNGVPQAYGSILTRWPGAVVSSGGNGNDDGRFFVADKVTPLSAGSYHYEFAVHNADNHRGGATLRIPIDATATASNFTFRDIDGNPLNDWLATRVGNEIVFTAPPGNPLDWNTIYNFGFDANYPPAHGNVAIDEARLGAGALFVTVPARVPSGGPTIAAMTDVGNGCGGHLCPATVYELFPTAAGFDLANSSWTLTFANDAYTMTAGTASYVTPAGIALPFANDMQITASLPFPIPFPGGSTSSLSICSNGFVSAASNGTAPTPTVAALLTGAPRWAALWHDLNPSLGGQIRIETSASTVRVTFVNVPNATGGGTATFQYQFFPNGTVNVVYQAVATAGNAYLVGFSSGGGVADPGNTDLSASLAGSLAICSPTITGLELDASAAPVLGTTIQLTTSHIPGGTLLGLQIFSLNRQDPPIDLASLGMPSCELHLALDEIRTFTIAGASAAVPYTLPSSTAVAGTLLMTQSATWTPAANPFGFLTSNAVALIVGVQ